MKDKTFEYGGYHFVPVGNYDNSDSGFQESAFRLRTDHELGFHANNYYGTQKFSYTHKGFYKAAGIKKCDIFRCLENGKLYIPCGDELLQYVDPPEKLSQTIYDEDLGTSNETTPAKRMAGDYEIIHAVRISDREVVFGRNDTLTKPYFCALCKTEQIAIYQREIYAPWLVGADYIEMMRLFSAHLKEQCNQVRLEQAEITVPLAPITPEMCLANDYSKAIEGKVVAVKLSALRPEYQSASHQLIYVTGGNGAQANARGSACFHKNLYTGESGRWERRDIQGEVKPECLPDWTKTRLAEILKQEQQKKANKEAR